MIFSILVVSRSYVNLNSLLESILNSINIDFSRIEILCSWNGLSEDEVKINASKKINFKIVDRSSYHFASNINTLASIARGDFLCVVNDDVYLSEYSLYNSLKWLDKRGVGIVGSVLLFPNGKIQHCGISFRDDLTPFHLDKHGVLSESVACFSPRIVEACTGALFFCKRKLYNIVKMSEKFKECGEDICFSLDMSHEFKELSVIVPHDVIAIHKEGETRSKLNKQGTPLEDLTGIKLHAKKINKKRLLACILTEEEGWIFYRMAKEIFRNSLTMDIRINEWDDSCDVVYFIHYARYDEAKAKDKIAIANFTHYVPGTNAEPLFREVAHKVDFCVAISEATRHALLELGVADHKIQVINIGAAKEFTPKTTFGLVGRTYGDGRKGEDLVEKLISDKDILQVAEFVSMNECWGVKTLNIDSYQLFYSCIDFLLVPSRIEGGPVPFMEALACGKLSVAPPIGVIPSFPHIEYETGDFQSMKKTILKVSSEHISKLSVYSSSISSDNWEKWAFEHHLLFNFLVHRKNHGTLVSEELSILVLANKLYKEKKYSAALSLYEKIKKSNLMPEFIIDSNIRMVKRKITEGLGK